MSEYLWALQLTKVGISEVLSYYNPSGVFLFAFHDIPLAIFLRNSYSDKQIS